MKLKIDITKENFYAWVSELRNDKYTQGSDYLKVNDGGLYRHCCLGVLCEVLKYPQINGNDITLFQYGGEEFNCELPLCLTPASDGYTDSCGYLPNINTWSLEQKEKFADVVKQCDYESEQQHYIRSVLSLAYLNDSGKFNFERLADVIEEFLEPAI